MNSPIAWAGEAVDAASQAEFPADYLWVSW
jgi:hypothetical protein